MVLNVFWGLNSSGCRAVGKKVIYFFGSIVVRILWIVFVGCYQFYYSQGLIQAMSNIRHMCAFAQTNYFRLMLAIFILTLYHTAHTPTVDHY